MAQVWKAIDEVLEREVAVKILNPGINSGAEIRDRFRQEALAAARLTHPNVVPIFDTGDHDDVVFIVMEYLSGGTLKDLSSNGPIDSVTAQDIGIAVCEALNYAHTAGVIHRDIKPSNILFGWDRQVKVGDFGIAKATFTTPEVAPLGSLRYLAPEQVRGSEPDERADIYSLGLVLYEAVAGHFPFAGETEMAIAADRLTRIPRPLRDLRPDVPRALDAALTRCLAVDPADRFEQVSSLADALVHSATRGHSMQQISQPPQDQTSFLKSESKWLARAALILLAAAALIYTVVSGRLDGIFDDNQTSIDEAGARITIQAAGTFDPKPGDGSENETKVGAAFDTDAQTAWTTASYRRDDLGGLKDGVGIYVDLGRGVPVSRIEVDSVTGGWQGTIRFSDDAETWSPPGASIEVSTSEVFHVKGQHRYWMIWITRLARAPRPPDSGRDYSVAIIDIRTFS